MKSLFRTFAGASCVVVTLAVSGCGAGSGDSTPPAALPADATASPADQVTAAPAPDAEVVKITIGDGTVSPSGASLEVSRDQPVVLQIAASSAGQLHVHSSPQQVIDYPAGESEITVTFTIPGIVDVEDHDLGEAIIQFEVN